MAMDDLHSQRSLSLLQYISDEGLLPSPEDDLKRESIINKLKTVVLKWIKRVAWQRRLPPNEINAASATVLTYGSYSLGVHNSESDIDALCIGPRFASQTEDFFVVLCNMLRNTPGVSDVQSVQDAKVPLMQLKIEGISVDMPYAQLQVTSISENVDVLDPVFLTAVDDNSTKSLSAVRANQSILQLLPNLQLIGYLGGIHLAILAAFICLKNPDAGLSALVMIFFSTFASWPWPTPVVLQDEGVTINEDMNDTMSWMPIRMPCSPFEICHSNVTRGTFNRIRTEFFRGHSITKDMLSPDFNWTTLFEPVDYQKRYTRFLKIYLSSYDKDYLGDWVGFVKSHFRCLILKLEKLRRYCDPNLTEYVETGSPQAEPNIVFYWGLHPSQSTQFNIASIEDDFLNHLNGGPVGKIRLSGIQSSEVPSCTLFPMLKGKVTKARWRTVDYDQQRAIAFSQHLPKQFIG